LIRSVSYVPGKSAFKVREEEKVLLAKGRARDARDAEGERSERCQRCQRREGA
jgi:hypothetical protein